ncbi:MAG: hypothetical protein ACYDEJ_01810 [Desulfitobacteriaceae bacterium]
MNDIKYNVDKQDIPFELTDSLTASETVVVTFFDKEGIQRESKAFGYFSKEELIN